MPRPVLIGVGVGPGDPELVTVKAVRVLDAADVVFVPVSEGHGPYGPRPADALQAGGGVPPPGSPPAEAAAPVGRAEATVRAHVGHGRIRRLPFRMTGEADYATPASAVAAALTASAAGGAARTVAFATIGDPNVYSTFTQLAAHVRALVPELAVETIPGIMAFQDLAARSGTVLAHGAETVALLPLTAGVEAYRRAVADHDTVVAYKGGRALPQVLDVLDEAGRLDGTAGAAVYGAALGLPDSDVRPAGELPREPGPYLSTILSTRRPPWPT
jgi:precorrin-2/cobalt-factor-2 C20-methyltransferase